MSERLRIVVVTPSARGAHTGNRTTAERWARILRRIGHRVVVTESWRGRPCDVLVALHARRSRDSISRIRRDRPGTRLVVALTGTDLYVDLPRSAEVASSLALADRVVVLQSLALDALPAAARGKARVIHQSVVPPRRVPRPSTGTFDVCVLAHLRPVKDPLRAALAARRLPPDSRVRVRLVGAALSPALARRARDEERRNPRFRSTGEMPRSSALRILGGSRLMVISSRSEGGANALSEAIALGIPVLASRIDGNVGLLGADYPGYFDVGDTRALAVAMLRAEREPRFLGALASAVARRRRLVDPRREEAGWRALLEELSASAD